MKRTFLLLLIAPMRVPVRLAGAQDAHSVGGDRRTASGGGLVSTATDDPAKHLQLPLRRGS